MEEKSKILSKNLYDEKLAKIYSVKVKAINILHNIIEINYIADNKEKYFTISGFYKLCKCSLKFDTKKLQGATSYDVLSEINYIHDISYELHYLNDKECEKIVMTANDKQGKLKRYTLFFKENCFCVDIKVLKNSFISKIISKDDNLVVSLSYDEKNIYLTTIKDDRYEGKIHRLHTPNYVSNLKYNPKKKIELKKDKDSIYLTNLSFKGSGFILLEKEHYDRLDNEDKANFDRFANELVEFLNTLFINKIFNFYKKIDFESEKEYQNFIDSFKNQGFKFERVYLETYRGVPSLEVFRVSKDDIEFKLRVDSDIVVEWYSVEVECNDLRILNER